MTKVFNSICFSLLFVAALTKAQFVVDEDFITTSIVAAELSILAKEENPVSDGTYDIFASFRSSSPDSAIVAKRDETCFVAFASNLPSKWQHLLFSLGSLFSSFKETCSPGGDCCQARTHVTRNFAAVSDSIETPTRDCVASCTGGPCALVVTGHANGGAGKKDQ